MSAAALESDPRRAQKLSAAKKKLRQFRASRTIIDHSPSPSMSISRNSSISIAPGKPLDLSPRPSPIPSPISPTFSSSGMSRRVPSHVKADFEAFDDGGIQLDVPRSRHSRKGSGHRRQSSSFSWSRKSNSQSSSSPTPSIVGTTEVPYLDHDDADGSRTETSSDRTSHKMSQTSDEQPLTPATPTAVDETESTAAARLSTFSFGAKSGSNRSPLATLHDQISSPLPYHALPSGSRPPSMRLLKSPPLGLDGDSLSKPSSRPNSRSNSPPPSRKRHSHNRSESISLPNLKLGGRPTSLGLPSPNFPSTPSSPVGDRNSRNHTPTTGSRLKFEPSDKEKEESRRRALDKLTGGGLRFDEPPRTNEITLPSFDEDEDDFCTTSSPSRPTSTSTRTNSSTSTSSSSRPSSLTVNSTGSQGSFTSSTSPLPWTPTFEEPDRWSGGFSQRFDPKEESVFGFDLSNKTSSVLLNSNLGVLTEEDETESDAAADETDMPSASSSVTSPTSPTDSEDASTTTRTAGPTPSRLRELHLVSSVSSQGSLGSGRRSSNPELLQSFSRALAQARESPSKDYGTIGRGRPRPLGAGSLSLASPPSRPKSVGPSNRRPTTTTRSSISYKKDDSGSGSSKDLDATSPTSSQSPLSDWHPHLRGSTRPCPRPRSMMLSMSGTSGRILGEVSEEEEDKGDAQPKYDPHDDGVSNGRPSTEASRDSLDGWLHKRNSRDWSKRSSRDIESELERNALREDIDLWRKRCRGLEDRLDAEKRETTLLRERVRKLGDRLLNVSSSPGMPTPAEEREVAQSRLISEMRDQLFRLTSTLERERKDKADALARLAELQAVVDAAQTPLVSPASLPATPKSRPRRHSSLAGLGHAPVPSESARYADADFADDEVDVDAKDPNLHRMRGWGFPQGPVGRNDRESKRESFFGLSRPRTVRPAASGSDLGLAWGATPSPHGVSGEGAIDLPPIVVNDNNRNFIVPVPVRTASHAAPKSPGLPRTTPHAAPPSPGGVNTRDRGRDSRVATAPRPVPTLRLHAAESPERSPTGFGLSFLSGYLPYRSSPPSVPRIAITPSSVSPKKSPLFIDTDPRTRNAARFKHVTPASPIDFRHACKRCQGEVIEL